MDEHEKTTSKDLNFIKRSNLRLTNVLIKSIMETHKNANNSDVSNPTKDSSITTSLLNSSKNKISKKNKTKLKKQFWHDSKLLIRKKL